MLSPRFRTPATSGSYKSAGLPNIEGSTTLIQHILYSTGTGAISTPVGSDSGFSGGSGIGNRKNLTFDASRSNSIYGNSSTVQPNSFTVQYIIKY